MWRVEMHNTDEGQDKSMTLDMLQGGGGAQGDRATTLALISLRREGNAGSSLVNLAGRVAVVHLNESLLHLLDWRQPLF